MARRWQRIFSAGIEWDPQEPLPTELRGYYGHNTDDAHSLPVRLHAVHLGAAHVDNIGPFPDGDAGKFLPGVQAIAPATTWSRTTKGRGKVLPRFTVQEQRRNVLPPLSVTVDASIVQDTARVTVTQFFWNDSSIPIKEAAFTFPLPAGCTVTDFNCRVGTDKIIKGTVKPKEEARDAFKQHIRTQDTAAGLLEQDNPEVFTTTLGNIPEKTKVRVNLTYIALLKHRFADSQNATTLTLPTSIAPRYGAAPEEYNDAATADIPQGLKLEIEIVESEKIASITSPSHAIAIERRRGARTAESFADLAGDGNRSNIETACVTLESGPLFLEKDFVLDIATTPDNDTENPQAWLEEHPSLPNHKAVMLTLPPGFLTRNAPPMQRSEIMFLADRSGSMSDKIASLKSAMQFFLKGIPEGRKFNIWCFGSSYTSWQPGSVEYTEATLGSALSWVENTFAADMGGTELLEAIKAAVSARDKDLMTDVIVLTDGQTWYLDQTMEYIQKIRGITEGRVRFFALGIGKSVSHALVDGIAKAGGGYAEVVQEASRGGWEDRVVSMAKAALMSAHVGPLHLEFNIQDKDGNTKSSTLVEAKRSPADVSAISPFDRSRIYFLFDSFGEFESIKSVKIEATANQVAESLIIPLTALEKQDTTLHKLAARAMLDDLERGRSHIHLRRNRPYPGSWEETVKVRKEAEAIACKWSLVSKWTSFFLAEEPCQPTGHDTFMDTIVEVRDAPGDDLLEPRRTNRHLANIVSAEPNAFRPTQRATPPGQNAHLMPIPPPPPPAIPTGTHFRIPPPPTHHIGSSKTFDLPPLEPDYAIIESRSIFSPSAEDVAAILSAHQSQPPSEIARDNETQRLRKRFESKDRKNRAVKRGYPKSLSDKEFPVPGPVPRSGQAGATTYIPQGDVYGEGCGIPSSQEDLDWYFAWTEKMASGWNGMEEGLNTVTLNCPSSNSSNLSNPNQLRSKHHLPTLKLSGESVGSGSQVETPRSLLGNGDPNDGDTKGVWGFGVPFAKDTQRGEAKNGGPRVPPDSWGKKADSSDEVSKVVIPYAYPDHHPRLPVEWKVTPAADMIALKGGVEHSQATALGDDEDSDDAIQKKRNERAFVSSLLQFQQYDGAIDFIHWTTAEKYLGKDIADALKAWMLQTRPSEPNTPSAAPSHTPVNLTPSAVWTAAVHVLLERDFQSCKPLWELMALKTASYCQKHPLGPTGAPLLEEVGKQLEGLKLPVYLRG